MAPERIDFTLPILPSRAWYVSEDGTAELVHDIVDLPARSERFPMVVRFDGFDPRAHVRRAGDGEPGSTELHELTLGANSHVDLMICLSGGQFAGLDEHPYLPSGTGTRMAEALRGGVPGQRPVACAVEGMILDMAILRQYRRVATDRHGMASNASRVVEEKASTFRRAYGPDGTPSRPERIRNLVLDALPFARVQADNLSYPESPRPEYRKAGR